MAACVQKMQEFNFQHLALCTGDIGGDNL